METVKPEDLEVAKTIFEEAYAMWLAQGGSWLLLLPLVPMALVKLYKTDFVQGLVELYAPKLAWANLALKYQMLLSFLLGALPVFLGAFTVKPFMTALMLGIGAGLAAVRGWKPMKMVLQSQVGANVLSKMPSMATKTMGLALPVDEARLAVLRELKKDGQVK